jgi:7-keto-8-aminopelargonate synthetase-like enzyme
LREASIYDNRNHEKAAMIRAEQNDTYRESKNRFGNISSMWSLSKPFWDANKARGLSEIRIKRLEEGGYLAVEGMDRPVLNMSSYSYLGFDEHPAIAAGGSEALQRFGMVNTSMSRSRATHWFLDETEAMLGDLFDCTARVLTSCTAAAASIIPALSAGIGLDSRPNLVAFDRNAHFSLNVLKPQIGDENRVFTLAHNDVDALEELCATNEHVLYIADSVYSTGGTAPVRRLQELQQQYRLTIVYDEAHGLSVFGDVGQGYILNTYRACPDNVFLVTSLNKGFGAVGGAIICSRANADALRAISLSGGQIMWSQRLGFGSLGSIQAAVDLHRSSELGDAQNRLRHNLSVFDNVLPCAGAGDPAPIRLVRTRSDLDPVAVASYLMQAGFYVAPVAFPIVKRGVGGVRVMIRANMADSAIEDFAVTIAGVTR